MGLFCFVGINEYSEEIIEIIEPDIKLDLFYYSCSKEFETTIVSKYIGSDIEGIIMFANGNECFGYQFIQGKFMKIFGLNANLTKRHNKGGYSANRFARIAEESRHLYVVRVCDKLREFKNSSNNINNLNIIIYGSEEIVGMIMKQSPIKLINGGFLNFNSNTISNSQYWMSILTKLGEKNYDEQYKEILEFLEVNPDMLDFDSSNKDIMKYFIEKKQTNQNELKSNQIPLIKSSKYYAKLMVFDYIGVKFYNKQINDFNDFNN